MNRRTSLIAALVFLATSAAADEIVLANGDKLNGEIIEWAIDFVVIEHPQLGRIRLALDQLEIDTGTPPKPGFFDTWFMRGWNRTLSMGLNGRQGDTNLINIQAGWDFNYKDDFRRWSFNGTYFFNKEDDGDNDNNLRVDLRRDWLVPERRWFAFAAFRYQYDQFESWRHRTTLSAGPGFHLVESEAMTLNTTVGLAFTREFGDRQTEQGEFVWGLDWRWQITKRQSFSFQNNLFPQFAPDAGEFRNLTLAEYKVLLAENPKLTWNVGLQNDYETDIEPGDKKNDLRYYMGLGVDW